MNDLLTAGEAWGRLQGHVDDIRACLVAGWNVWDDLGDRVPEHRIKFDTTTRAGIVNNAIAAEASKRFFDVPGVRVTRKGRMLNLIFGGDIILRFKKVDRSFRTRNVRTKQAVRLEYQMQVEGFPAHATVIVAGYLLTALQDAVQGNWLVCSKGTDLEWKIPLDATPPPSPLLKQDPNGGDPVGPTVKSAKVAVEEAQEEARG